MSLSPSELIEETTDQHGRTVLPVASLIIANGTLILYSTLALRLLIQTCAVSVHFTYRCHRRKIGK